MSPASSPIWASDPMSAPAIFQVEFRRSGVTAPCDAETNIWHAARAAGLKLPSSCLQGVCGTCKSPLVSGSVDMKHGGGIRQREIDKGMILICCSRPLGDVVIDR
jgi:ferredoxin